MMEKKYNHLAFEKEVQDFWEEKQTFIAENNPGPLYSIDTPPPTVSGELHIGHIFSYTQTDIIARYKRMNGFSVFYPFGFDDNGLATERYVEKKRMVRVQDLSRSEFIKLCLQETKKAEELFKDLWQRIGLSVDWNLCYSTISDRVRTISQESFIELYKKGYIYRKDEPALYCTQCQTSVAQAELEDKEQSSFFNDIIFKDEANNDLIISTTRPELLFSCVALLYNPKDERYVHLKGKRAIVPVFDHQIPILEDEQVDIEKGTGLVMCCTFGDSTDIIWYKKYNLPYRQSIGRDGRWVQTTGILAGLTAPQAREKIVEELKKQNLILRQEVITHVVNAHERCKKEIEFIVLPQWFLNILEHKETFLTLADKINWYPPFMKARYRDWVENLSWNWGISRQRFYGIPFPVWYCQDCNAVLLANVKDLPVDPQEIKFKGACPECSGSTIAPETDIMDTWNTSSLTPYICYTYYNQDTQSPIQDERIRDFIPMNMRPQAHDIIRTWAFYTIVKAWMHHQTIPWKDIVISGHVLSDKKEKLSKSRGRDIYTPEYLLKTYPADAIRFWTASGKLGHDITFSESQLNIGRKLITKLWNAFKFAQEHITKCDLTKVPPSLGVINEWLLHTVSSCFIDYTKYFEMYEFSLALDPIEKFFWKDFCDNYLEIIKDQFFNPDNYDSKTIEATRWTLYTVGLRIVQMYAPYLSHVTEVIYQKIYKNGEKVDSIHQTRFESIQREYIFDQSIFMAEKIIAIVSRVRKLKSEQKLSLKTVLVSLTLYAESEKIIDQLKEQEQIIRGVTQTQDIKYKVDTLKESSLKQIEGLWHAELIC